MKVSKQFKLNLIAAACMSVTTPAISGTITGIATGTEYTSENGAFGIGGLNLGNVDVQIVNADTGEVSGTFYPETGSYDPMSVGDTFKSLITVDGVTTGSLHGKDWPVGEPHGIKVVNSAGPTDVQPNDKPASCIVSTSFYSNSSIPNYDGPLPDEGWLDTADPALVNPTVCDSPFQTHKRFKVDALTPIDAATDAQAKPIDFVFNVEGTETDIREYMVLQKLNNYSDSRYTGLQIEIGFGTGANFTNAADVTGVGTNLQLSYTSADGTEDEYTFPADDRAKFSSGLFGTAEPPKHPNDGFFDTAKAFYTMTLDENGTKISSEGELGSNYTAIFGNWLPSKWEPQAIFFDDDANPDTDATLIAYYGPSPTDSTVAWRVGQAGATLDVNGQEIVLGSFEAVPDNAVEYYEGLSEEENALYSVGGIEDLLNLGLTYIVEVGDITTFSAAAAEVTDYTADTFTLRLLPVASTVEGDDETPAFMEEPTSETSSGGSASEFSFLSLVLGLLGVIGLGGWLASRKKA